MNLGAFLMRGLVKVRADFGLTALARHLRRAQNIIGVADLMAAMPLSGQAIPYRPIDPRIRETCD
jgi:hypothetical protein